jgi:DNA-binding NtrC family response regulator
MEQPQFPFAPLLLVDDEEQFLLTAEFVFNSIGMNNLAALSDSRKVMETLAQKEFSVIVLDLYMPHITGLDLLPEITALYPHIPVIILTAVNELETAVQCMKNGAFDYMVKPVRNERLVSTIRRALEYREMNSEITSLKEHLLTDTVKHPEAFRKMITQNSAMRSIFQYVEAIAGTSLPVLVTGETGTGKELIAKAIHTVSGRKGAFVTLNVAGVDDTLFSDTLFGHIRGAFTGAEKDRRGLIEEASGGTLFLDEIGDLGMESQVKLLRILQEHAYYPLGADASRLTDSRIVAATNKDVKSLQDTGRFRKDLFYRLYAHHIHLPPLRERKGDIPLLIDYLLGKAAIEMERKKPSCPKELEELFSAYHFPGNIREMEGMIYDAVSRHRSGVLSLGSFREKIVPESHSREIPVHRFQEPGEDTRIENLHFPDELPALKEMEDMLIREALRRSNGNQTIAARLLGISRTTLNSRLSRSGD